MTYPITPVPSVHHDPTLAKDAAAETRAALQSLRLLFSKIPGEILQLIVNAVLNSLGLSSIEGSVDDFLNALEAALHDIPMGNLSGFLSALGASFPKTFPFQFGTATSGALAKLVSLSQFQQLVDGIVNDGTGNHTVDAAVGALQKQLATARSDISQAILDGVNAANSHTGIAAALQAFPHTNITSILGSADLGADVQAIVAEATAALGGFTSTLSGLAAALGNIPNANIAAILGGANLGADVQAIVDTTANALGFAGSNHSLANLLTYLAAIPLGNVSGLLSGIGSSFPKTFPFQFGTATSGTLAQWVSRSQFQQLVDGLVNNGTANNDVTAAIGAYQSELATARSDISQAILDGVNAINSNTGISQALQAFPYANVTSLFGNAHLGADVQAVVDRIANALGFGGNGHSPAQLLTYLEQIPGTVVDASVGFLNQATSFLKYIDVASGLYDASQGFKNQAISFLKYLDGTTGLYDASQGFNNATTSLLKNLGTGGSLGLYDASAGFLNQTTSLLKNLDASTFLYDAGQGFKNQSASVLQYLGTGGTLGLYDASQGFVNSATSLLKHLGTGGSLGLYDASVGFANQATSLLKKLDATTGLYDASAGFSNLATSLLKFIDSGTGLYDSSQGFKNTAASILRNLDSTGNLPLANVLGLLSSIGSSFPKTFPFQFGTATSGTLMAHTPLSQFQQLVDGIIGDGTQNNPVSKAVGALQSTLATARSDVSQAILDGVNAVNSHTGISAALQAFPHANVTNILGGLHLGADLQNVVDAFANGINGTSLTGQKASDVTTAATGTAGTLTSHSSSIAAIQATLGGGSSGLNDVVTFSGTLPASFTNLGGAIAVLGGTQVAQYNASTALTAVQSVSGIWSANPTSGNGYYLFLRANSAFTTFVVLQIFYVGGSNYAWNLLAVVSGSATSLNSGGLPGPVANNAITLSCDSGYNYKVKYNGSTVATVVDGSHVSQITMPTYNNFGYGTTEASLPGLITQWGCTSPAAAIGSVFRQYRTLTASSGAMSSGSQLLPNSFFDTNQYLTSDFTSAPATANQLTVSVAGTYMVNIVLLGGTVSNSMGPALFRNGSVEQVGNSVGSGAIQAAVSYGSSFEIYCNALDTLQPGVWSAGSSNTYVGEATGTRSYWSVALMNCGTIS